MCLVCNRIDSAVEQVVARNCLSNDATIDLALIGESLQGANDQRLSVDVEETTCCTAGVGNTEAVGTEHTVLAGHPLADQILGQRVEVGGCDERAFATGQFLREVRGARCFLRVEEVVLVGIQAVATQFVPRGH